MNNSSSIESLLEWASVPSEAKVIIKNYISEQKIEREIAQRYLSLYQEVPIGLYRTTPDGQILEVNPYLIEMLGYDSFEELASLNLEKDSDQFHPSYPRSEFKEQLKDKSEVGLEARWQRKDGSFIFVRENAKSVTDPSGRILYYEGSVEDITEKKEAEAALQESEERYRSLFEESPVALCEEDLTDLSQYFMDLRNQGITDFQSYFDLHPEELKGLPLLIKVLDVNSACLKLYGVKDKQLFSESIEIVYPEESLETLLDSAIRLTSGETIVTNESINRRLDTNELFNVLFRTAVISYPEKEIIRGIASIVDVTAEKKLEKMRADLEERRENFIHITSHELRTPLTVCLSYSDFLLTKQELPLSERFEIYSIMKRNLDRLERLVQGVSSSVQIDKGIFSVTFTEFDFRPFFNELLNPYFNRLKEGLVFTDSQTTSSIVIKGDKDRLQQVFENIIENAIKHTSKTERKI
ncbi:MAG: PAS domain-containing sensor histidine kinase, partial [Candidatus Hodarchaeales archaeon]